MKKTYQEKFKEDTQKKESPKKEFHKKEAKKEPKKEPPEKEENSYKLTPAEVWQNAAKLLDTKKEPAPAPKKEDKPKPFTFADIKKKFDALRDSRSEDARNYYRAETENAVVYGSNIQEIDRIKNYRPRNPAAVPPFFPKTPIHIFEGPDVYRKLDVDTLFFIFYYQPNTIQQYFTAKELKNYSWRFHTKYLTWFQRLEEPKLITEYYEQGIFLFFDYDVTWSNRKKRDFTFEYKYLENVDM